jgi:carbon monoxide dehydrogenase subunit G
MAMLMLLLALAATPDVAVAVHDRTGGGYAIDGSFTVPASGPVVWSVLTDYDHLGAFLPGLRSRVLERRGEDATLVAQEALPGVGALRLKSRVLLQVDGLPYARIGFTDVAHRDFKAFSGSWRLTQQEPLTRVDYHATAFPRFAPPLVGAHLVQENVREMLRACRAEVLRRAR